MSVGEGGGDVGSNGMIVIRSKSNQCGHNDESIWYRNKLRLATRLSHGRAGVEVFELF